MSVAMVIVIVCCVREIFSRDSSGKIVTGLKHGKISQSLFDVEM